MNIDVLTLFPEEVMGYLHTSILGRAMDRGVLHVSATNIRDYSTNKFNRVDDYPYGGGAGMVIEAEPVYQSWLSACGKLGGRPRTVYLTPQGRVLNQAMAEELALEKNLILICGHYEGIDERVLEETVTDYISIGDYVLTGGELGAMVLIDAVSRFVPGVLGNEESSQFESLQDNLLEYPHFTRPEIWHDRQVPGVLLSGDHKKIEAWRYQQSVERTGKRRPDLLSHAVTVISTDAEDMPSSLLAARLSRYPARWDLTRRKMRKTTRVFNRSDLVLLALPKDAEPEEALLHIRGRKTPVILVGDGFGDAVRNSLTEKGFTIVKSIPSLMSGEELTRTCAGIREDIYQGRL